MKKIFFCIGILWVFSCQVDNNPPSISPIDEWSFVSESDSHSSTLPEGLDTYILSIDVNSLCQAYGIELIFEMNGVQESIDTVNTFPFTQEFNLSTNSEGTLKSRSINIDSTINCIWFGQVDFSLDTN